MAIENGPLLNSVPQPQKKTLSSNYLDLAGTANEGWAQQFVPDLMEKEAEVFGNRTISGFLSKVGAEEAMAADQVVWSEQGRLHLSYTGTVVTGTGVFDIDNDIDGAAIAAGATAEHGVRLNDLVIVAMAEGSIKCIVTDIDDTNVNLVTVKPFAVENIDDDSRFTGTLNATLLVYGSEWKKGSNGQGSAAEGPKTVDPVFKSFSNKPIIIKV